MTDYNAQQFVAPDGVEVSGILLLAYTHNLESEVTEPILKEYGFEAENLHPEEWYPGQLFLDIEKTIHDSPGGEAALTAIGKSAAENFIPPAGEQSTIEDVVLALPGVYTTNQRNLPAGYGWIVEKKGEQKYHFINNTGTTNHGAYGYVWAVCNRMKADGQTVRVIPLQGFEPGSTEPTIIEITWDE
ncbi:MAG: hypothetical protein AAGK74_15535 [Chloroflexota bacterium]